MIRIGYTTEEKQMEVKRYLKRNTNINAIHVIYFKDFPFDLDVQGIEIEHVEFSETIMYRTFYPLLEKIDKNSLIIINECMRTQKRQDLRYNCIHHYLNQAGHRIVFEYLPIIEHEIDFMILLDFENKSKYYGKPFDYDYFGDENILMEKKAYRLINTLICTTAEEKKAYEVKKEELFETLGKKDPDTIPRNLQLLAGNYKKKAIDAASNYVARNKRFNKSNIVTYSEVCENHDYTVIDFHHRRLNFNDFLKKTGIEEFEYISTDLSIDKVLVDEFTGWKERLETFYDQASLHQ